ncbi:MAG: 4-hydroxy-tetrahydrodipicolinate synthase [Xanthobacteraceae bacterium]|nr:4-hydroxy-tetrahydrodipicolinate synthase [Xanthobacteraceae bacterium]
MTLTMHDPATWLAGYIPDLPTPFDASGEIDLAAFEKLCERQIAAGAKALVVGETTGEGSTLTQPEHSALVRAAIRTSQGRAAIVAGTGSNSTSQAIELTHQAQMDGADAILSMVPYYNKPMQSGIYAHFCAVAGATRLPIILHDVPSRTAREMTDDTITRLAQSQQFAGLRDDTGDISRSLRLRPLLPPEFRLLSGDDTTAPAFLVYGGNGCISITSNVMPELCRKLYLSCTQGELKFARSLAIRLSHLTAALLREPTPAPLKYALSLLGLMSPRLRLPLVELAEPGKADVASAMDATCFEDLACTSNQH